MSSTEDKENAVRLLKIAIQNRANSGPNSSSNLSHSLDQSSTNNSTRNRAFKSSDGNNLLSRCFDQTSTHVPSYLHECNQYLNSTIHDTNDDDDSMLSFESLIYV